jgi:hypothetical protein
MIIRDGTPPGFPRVTLLTYEQRIVARLITRAKLVGQNKTGLFAPSRMILHVCKRGTELWPQLVILDMERAGKLCASCVRGKRVCISRIHLRVEIEG